MQGCPARSPAARARTAAPRVSLGLEGVTASSAAAGGTGLEGCGGRWATGCVSADGELFVRGAEVVANRRGGLKKMASCSAQGTRNSPTTNFAPRTRPSPCCRSSRQAAAGACVSRRRLGPARSRCCRSPASRRRGPVSRDGASNPPAPAAAVPLGLRCSESSSGGPGSRPSHLQRRRSRPMRAVRSCGSPAACYARPMPTVRVAWQSRAGSDHGFAPSIARHATQSGDDRRRAWLY